MPVAALALAAALSAVASGAPADLRVDQLSWLGSHNSYRPAPGPQDLARLRATLGPRSAGLEYGHLPIARQLDLGIRQLEFDPWADSAGGRYAAAHPDDPAQQAAMQAPGPKVLHIPVVDERTLCASLAQCFQTVADWSQAHRAHDLIVIFVNVKEEETPVPGAPKPELWTSESLGEVDRIAVAAFGRAGIVTPDDVRGGAASLREAVMAHGWPGRIAARGKVLLVLDSSPRVGEVYRAGHPSLGGRVMFGLYDEAEPEAAVFNIQDPRPQEHRIRRLVAAGFLVRTRSDADTREARAGDHGRLDAAIRSTAQIVSTDYYAGAPDPLGLKFVVTFPASAR
ncbi:phosphatidylinositol-specific phospholipase C domain-containing protein [Phenylobacterium sp. LjRoot225]|uniref:phosphatidylinositol-specific phospholipase C domain-containing protein n=1 Tax=Phenylobacterium sp. LjRoot225 TaxID=3342285 RepID=UPI003ECD7281